MNIFPLSKTLLAVFQKCPWRAWVEKTSRLQMRASDEAQYGIDAHRVMSDVLCGAREVPPRFRSIFTVESILARKGTAEEFVSEVWIGLGPNMNRAPYNAALYHGFLDLIFKPSPNVTVVEDLKTGVWEVDDEIERKLYSCMAFSYWPADTIVFRRWYVKSGNSPTWEMTPDDIHRYWKELRALSVDVEDADPDPNPGPHCDNWYGQQCPWRTVSCPAYNEIPLPPAEVKPMSGVETFLASPLSASISDVAKYASGYEALGAFRKQLKKSLAQWVEHYGSIQLNDGRLWGRKSKRRGQVDTAAAYEVLLEAGASPEVIARVFSVTPTAIRKLPAQFGDLKWELERLIKESETTDYGLL